MNRINQEDHSVDESRVTNQIFIITVIILHAE